MGMMTEYLLGSVDGFNESIEAGRDLLGFLVVGKGEGDLLVAGETSLLTETDRETLSAWFVPSMARRRYSSRFYRIELSSCIFICNRYAEEDGEYLFGHLLRRSITARATLLSAHQNHVAQLYRRMSEG